MLTNEQKALLTLFKDFTIDYNSRQLSAKISITPMGTLKVLRKLESKKFVKAKPFGKAIRFKVNFSSITSNYISYSLEEESQQALPRARRWITELQKFNFTEIGILFGSVLNSENYNDVDFLIVFSPRQQKKVKSVENEINALSNKKLHLIMQTKQDFISNIKSRNKVVLEAISKGIVVFGYNNLVKVIQNATEPK